MYQAILAVDPGLRTGFASWDRWGTFAAGICDPTDAYDYMERWANAHSHEEALLVVEKFTITAATAQKSTDALYWPTELTGVGRYLAWRCGCKFENDQTPSAAKRFATDAKLKKHGMYTPGTEDHARDASRHLLLKLSKLRLL